MLMDQCEDAEKSGQTTFLSILGAVRLIATAVLCWMFVIWLTPPNRPVDNGLEVVFPGVIIVLIGFPSAIAGIVLTKYGVNSVKFALRVDTYAILFFLCGALLVQTFWVLLGALPFAADAALLAIVFRE